ncbi:MAG: UPF0158 family protein [Coriobacteriia bacterium]|nr:UPF0158 family protein [Coriobacteriia bacterium]
MITVALSRIVDGIEGSMSDDWGFYLDKKTGETVELDGCLLELLEALESAILENGIAAEEACDCLREEYEDSYAFDILSYEESIDCVIELVGHELVDIESLSTREEYRLMEDFIETLDNEHDRQLLFVAIEGRGAFRRFKDTAASIGKLQAYFHFKDKAAFQAAREWCEHHEIKYSDDWERIEKLRYLDKGYVPA